MEYHMNKYIFRIFYQFLGPTDNDRLGLHQRSEEDIQFELENFPEVLRLNWGNELIHLETSFTEEPNSIRVIIETSESINEVKNKLVNCLKGTVLFGSCNYVDGNHQN